MDAALGGSIKKQKLGFLQLSCSELELDVSESLIRKKATYLALLELEVVEIKRVQLHQIKTYSSAYVFIDRLTCTNVFIFLCIHVHYTAISKVVVTVNSRY